MTTEVAALVMYGVGAGIAIGPFNNETIQKEIEQIKANDAVIVGTELKEDGNWRRPVDRSRVRRFVDAFRRHRSSTGGITP